MKIARTEMEVNEAESAEPWEAALVAVIRIFAARGQAIREAREKQENLGGSQCGCGGPGSVDSVGASEIGNPALEETETRSKGKAANEVYAQTAELVAEGQSKVFDT